MTEYRRIAVLDIGKTNAKVVVLDAATGEEIAVEKTANAVVRGEPYTHYDTDALWSFALGAFRRFAADPGYDAISITTHGASAVLLGADGKLAMPVIDYEYDYPHGVHEAYAALRPPFRETLSPSLGMGLNVGAQIHFQKTRFPEAFAKVAAVLTYPQYWAVRLTGIVCNEVTSLGCHTDLWTPATGTFSTLVDTRGIRDLMAPIRSAFDVLGPVLPEVAKEIGVSVPVYCGIHDSNASLLPHLVAREAPFAVVSTGTWVINFGVGGDLAQLDPARDALANVDAYGRAVPSSRFMGGREFEMLTAEIGPVPDAEIEAALADAIRKRVMLTPNLVPGSGPFPGRRSEWLNTGFATPAEKRAAACLYLGLMTMVCLDLIGAKGPIIVEGPFASNGVYLKILAALAERPVIAVQGSTGTSQGASLLAGIEPIGASSTTYTLKPIEQLQAYRRQWLSAVA